LQKRESIQEQHPSHSIGQNIGPQQRSRLWQPVEHWLYNASKLQPFLLGDVRQLHTAKEQVQHATTACGGKKQKHWHLLLQCAAAHFSRIARVA
jgi:hypothetical protein